jgi:excisionase family DNA binding protein
MIDHIDRLITLRRAADLLGVSPRSVRRLVERRELAAAKVLGSLRVSLASVLAYQKRQLDLYAYNNGPLKNFDCE